MKKNRMMRLASVLLVAVLMTTCTISGTFAKYVTEVSSYDTARVAKWGFTATSMDITGLFAKAYKEQPVAGEPEATVLSTADVIAPGTTNSATFSFVYSEGVADAPEVDYNFTVSTAGSSIAADIENNDNIKWKLDEGSWGTWDKLLADIAALSGDASGTKKYDAGQLPAEFTKNDDVHTITWKWAFDQNDDITGFDAIDLDTTDTAMGNGSVDALAVTLKITITATQID